MMKLLNAKSLEFRDFYLGEIPPYAILSHTWGEDEVTYQDILQRGQRSTTKKKSGYNKIKQTCDTALLQGFTYVWVDTCCIDKSSSSELSESINSMFKWYSNAAVCYVYLEDFASNASPSKRLKACRWFTRGWTLQELIAPKNLEFYDKKWKYRGSKNDFVATISTCTGIPEGIILGQMNLKECSVAEKMSWSAFRKTTRVEDTAYSLLGIFDVNMPLLYGEGDKAFLRLQEEIVKRNNDLTIFAWDPPINQKCDYPPLFAQCPLSFAYSSGVGYFPEDFIKFSVTNKGLHVSGELALRWMKATLENGESKNLHLLTLGHPQKMDDNDFVGIYLRKIGPKLFCRDGRLPLVVPREDNVQGEVGNMVDVEEDYYIFVDAFYQENWYVTFRDRAIHIPVDSRFVIGRTVPETLWDLTDRVFLRPCSYGWSTYFMVIAVEISCYVGIWARNIEFVLLCDFREEEPGRVPICKLFEKGQYPLQEARLFRGQNRSESVPWEQIEIEAPSLRQLSNRLCARGTNGVTALGYMNISVFCSKEIVGSISTEAEVFSVRIEADVSAMHLDPTIASTERGP